MGWTISVNGAPGAGQPQLVVQGNGKQGAWSFYSQPRTASPVAQQVLSTLTHIEQR